MHWLVALSCVGIDAGHFKPGALILVDETIAAELDAIGAVRAAMADEIAAIESDMPAGETLSAGEQKLILSDLPPLHDLRMAAIGAAVATLAIADFTRAGLPRIAALKARLDFDPKGLEIERFKRETA